MLSRAPGSSPGRVVFARMDNLGDVLLSGPAVRALAAGGAEVVYLCSPSGRPAAVALPGVARVATCRLPWIDASPLPTTRPGMEHLVDTVADFHADEAVISTSFHQDPLPLALVMRMAGIERISAISVDYPGSLLDVRHSVAEDLHEVERALSLAEAAGYPLPRCDDRRLRINLVHAAEPDVELPDHYVVVHPGASVPARAWSEQRNGALVRALTTEGHHVVLTGGNGEVSLTKRLASRAAHPSLVTNLAGLTDFPALALTIGRAAAIVCGNTGPAHVAAAVGTPVVSIYAPTVPAARWRPWMVPHVLLGRQDMECAGCRARFCPLPGHPCVGEVSAEAAVAAVRHLTSGQAADAASTQPRRGPVTGVLSATGSRGVRP